MGKKQGRSSAPQSRLSLSHHGIDRHTNDGGIQSTTAGQSTQRIHQVRIRPVQGLPGTPASGQLAAGFHEVRRHHAHPQCGQHSDEEQPNGSGTSHPNRVALQEGQAADAFEHRIDGLKHGSFFQTVLGRYLHHPGQAEIHDPNEFSITATGRLEARRDARTLVGFTLGKGPVSAEMAVQTRHMVVKPDAVTDRPPLNPSTHPNNGASRFMAINPRRGLGSVVDFLNVGGTHPANPHPHEDFAGANPGHRNLLDPQIIYTTIHHRPHGLRSRRRHAAKLEPKALEQKRVFAGKGRRMNRCNAAVRD